MANIMILNGVSRKNGNTAALIKAFYGSSLYDAFGYILSYLQRIGAVS